MRRTSGVLRSFAIAGSIAAVASGALLAAPAATGAGSSPGCPADRLCLFFNSNLSGARADFAQSDSGLGNELFTDGPARANGYGVVVNNNAASARNNTWYLVTLYTDAGCQGRVDYVERGEAVNLNPYLIKNNISSMRIGDSPCINRDQSGA